MGQSAGTGSDAAVARVRRVAPSSRRSEDGLPSMQIGGGPAMTVLRLQAAHQADRRARRGVELNTGFWDSVQAVTSVLVDVCVLAAAVAAAVKFRVFRLFAHRYRSEVTCTHHELGSGRTVFETDYTVHNTGERPILISRVRFALHPSRKEGVLVLPDETQLLAERILDAHGSRRGLFQIEAGERSIFAMRCELPELPEVVFVMCQFSWQMRRPPGPYISMYLRDRARRRAGTG